MCRYSLFVFIALFIIKYSGASSQSINNYQLTENDYVGTLTDMSGSSQLIGSGQSQTSSVVTDLGFDFVFMGKVYNSFSVNTNGVLRFGDEQIIEAANTYGIPGNDRIAVLAAVTVEYKYWFWWISSNTLFKTNNNGKVHYKITGTSPNRVLTVEWLNVGFDVGTSTSSGTFQVRLYESDAASGQSGAIEIVYDSFSMNTGNYRNFSFRTGFGIGPENGNFVAIDHDTQAMTTTQNYVSGPVSGSPISYFNSSSSTTKLLYQFVSFRKPTGTFSNFSVICPSPNALTIQFDEDCADESGIAVYHKELGQPDTEYQFLTSLSADVTTVTDPNVTIGQQYVYKFYFLGEGKYSDVYYEFTSEPVESGAAYQAIASGDWNSTGTWGGTKPAATADAELGCARSVYLSVSGDEAIHDLIIQKGSFLTIEDGATLSISGDFVNNGVLNPVGTGKIILNGSSAQSITNNGQGISDDTEFTSTDTPITWDGSTTGVVAEAAIQITDTEFSAIKSINIDIDQAYLRNISVYLVAPNNEVFTLANSRGQAGVDYTDVTFIETGAILPPSTQNVNLTGEYRPEESFASYSGSFVGQWKLQVVNTFVGVGGQLNTFSMTLSKGTSNDLVLKDLTVDNTSLLGISLNSGVRVQGTLQLNTGIIHTTSDHILFIENTGQANEGNSNSYINGPMHKQGNTNFTFPLGNQGTWAPVTLENISGDTEVVFLAEYKKQGYGNFENRTNELGGISSNEYWEIEPVAGTSSVDIVFTWKNAAGSNITDLLSDRELIIAHYTGGHWVNEGGLLTITNLVTLDGHIRLSGINSFSPFTFGSFGVSTLPVTFTEFEGKNQQKNIHLDWTTGSEINNDYFEIQRSTNARDWKAVGTVKGNGTTNKESRYQFLDEQLANGTYFYRLKQVDYDGKYDFSFIIKVKVFYVNEEFTVFPNPAVDQIKIQYTSYPATVEIFSQTGNRVLQKEINEFENDIALTELKAGLYLIRLTHEGQSQAQKILVSP